MNYGQFKIKKMSKLEQKAIKDIERIKEKKDQKLLRVIQLTPNSIPVN